MTDIDNTTLRQQQIFAGLKTVISDCTGHDLSDADLDTPLHRFCKDHDVWDDLDLADLIYRIEHCFDFTCPREQWGSLFGVPSTGLTADQWEQRFGDPLTFRRLAQFIAEHLPPLPTFEPTTILNDTSTAAGAFLDIQSTLQQMNLTVEPFGPSTRLRDRLSPRQCTQLYERLRWLSANRLPRPRTTFWTILVCALFLTVPAGFIVYPALTAHFFPTLWLIIPLSMLGIVATFAAVIFLALQITRIDNRLPRGIVTFRDLAELIAAAHAESTPSNPSSTSL